MLNLSILIKIPFRNFSINISFCYLLRYAEHEGMERGMEKGMEKRNIEIAKQMLLDGENIDKIIKYTGLPRENIERLR